MDGTLYGLDARIEAYTLAFCLTRKDSRTPIIGPDLDFLRARLSLISLEVEGSWGICGATLKHAIGYEEVQQQVFDELSTSPGIQDAPFRLSFLHFLKNRYVGHRRRDIHMDGFCETETLSVAPQGRFAVRTNGQISTFSQQTCLVAVGYSREQFALGHWKLNQAEHVKNFIDNWPHGLVIRRDSTPTPPLPDGFETIINPEDQICSVGISREVQGDNPGVSIYRECHDLSAFQLPLGPVSLQPVGKKEILRQVTFNT